MFKNDFLKWHFSFIVPYAMTYILGLLRSRSSLAYRLHPLFGLASFIMPLIVYLLLHRKKLIRQMIKVNFNLSCHFVMKVARISTIIIISYFVISASSGIVLNYGLYNNVLFYQVLSYSHGIGKFLVPITLLTHVFSRLYMKSKAI